MAVKTLYATGSFRYGTRMLQAGDPVDMKASHQRLFTALGHVTDVAPKKAPAPEVVEAVTTEAVKAPKAGAKARKRKAAAKK
jgi:hypothetical protein